MTSPLTVSVPYQDIQLASPYSLEFLEDSYQNIGLSLDARPQILANVTDTMRVALNAVPITYNEIDELVIALADSPYPERTDRPVTVNFALEAGVFSKGTTDIISGNCDCPNKLRFGCDIRQGFNLVQLVPRSVRLPSHFMGVGTLPADLVEPFVRELALVSGVCKEMPGFDRNGDIEIGFYNLDLRRDEITAVNKFLEGIRNNPLFGRRVLRHYNIDF